MKLDASGVCSRCSHRRDQGKVDDMPFLFSDGNSLDPGEMPDADLLQLTQVEEMLISRVHVHTEVHQIRGVQYQYTGHVINFLRDTGKVYDQLSMLPRDLEVIIVRPADTTDDPGLQRQFWRDFRVRQSAVRKWLVFLRENSPCLCRFYR